MKKKTTTKKKAAQKAPPIMRRRGVIKPKPDAGPLPNGSPISIRRDPAARPIPPPPPGWEIVGKDDPRLKDLPCSPMVYDAHQIVWKETFYQKGQHIPKYLLERESYALPIATQSATPPPAQSPPPMIRLRLPSEKPTRGDGDKDGNIFTIFKGLASGQTESLKWPWNLPFLGSELAWFSLPDGLLPREPSQEEKWKQKRSLNTVNYLRKCAHIFLDSLTASSPPRKGVRSERRRRSNNVWCLSWGTDRHRHWVRSLQQYSPGSS